MQLNENEVHLWLTDLNAVDPALIPDYRKLMTDEEMARNQRYRFEEGRFADCVTRALARTVLSRYGRIEPEAWRFSKGEHGKPEICAPEMAQSLRFNLSHSDRYVVCAVALRRDLGVDIECVERKNSLLNIAERFFSPLEVEELFALPLPEQKSRFFDYWTLKEAFIKASGEGISFGLGNFSFSFPEEGLIDIGFIEAIEENPDEWRFWLFSPAPDHRLAVALRCGQVANPALRLFETVPLQTPVVERQLPQELPAGQ